MVYRTIVKKVFWEFDSIIVQNVSDILPLFCTPTRSSHLVSKNQEYVLYQFLIVTAVTQAHTHVACAGALSC